METALNAGTRPSLTCQKKLNGKKRALAGRQPSPAPGAKSTHAAGSTPPHAGGPAVVQPWVVTCKREHPALATQPGCRLLVKPCLQKGGRYVSAALSFEPGCLGNPALPRLPSSQSEEEQLAAHLPVLLGFQSCLRQLTSKVTGCNASFLGLEDH